MERIWIKAQAQCTKAGIPIQLWSEERETQHPHHLLDFVIDAHTGDRPPSKTAEEIRQHFFYPVIDHLIREMNRRFSPESCNVLKGIIPNTEFIP